jgi:lysophospholipase L1-like esterase
VVLAYGTNEVFERYPVSDYMQQYRDLVQRIRTAVPSAACLMIGPTDVMQADGFSHPRVLEVSRAEEGVAAELGCGYVGAHLLMGGDGSYAEWLSARPQLAGVDGVHLTVRGYQELGRLTADYLLTSYDRSVPPHAVAR